ncbi:MAG: MoxR family ATPase [Myxococcota bacterium]
MMGEDFSEFAERFASVEAEVQRVFLGHEDVVHGVLVAILARGHVLLEGVPGVGKTLLVRALGRTLGCSHRRIQFTPDLMPSDVTGSSIYSERRGDFEFRKGPIFTQLLLADEVNRAPAKTQSSMLEAMQERAVTNDGETRVLPEPFFVLATQNPIESAGTYPLPEAQLDRFLFKITITHPSRSVETKLLRSLRDGLAPMDVSRARPVVTSVDVSSLQDLAERVHVDDRLVDYVVELVAKTRESPLVQVGASPRAAIGLLRTAQVEAAAEGREYAIPDDVKQNAAWVLGHRIILQPDAEIEGTTALDVVRNVLESTPVPGAEAAEAQPE